VRVVLYARVSTQRQAEQDLSIPDQFRQLREYCTRNKLEVVRDFQDPGASATDDNRPGFQEMVAFALDRGNAIDAILVLTSSHFFRDALGARVYKQKLQRRGIKAISITQDVGDGPSGEMVEQIFKTLDQYESRMNAYHTLRGMKANARQGNFNGSRPPFGYSIQNLGGEDGKSKSRLVVDTGEAETVRLMYSLYVDGLDDKRMGIKALTNYLNANGHSYREGKQWTKQQVQEKLSDRTYFGERYFNRVESKTRRTKPESDWILVPVEPIITEDLFRRVEEIRKRNRPSKSPHLQSADQRLF
jgi:site-specific DNA recombinase